MDTHVGKSIKKIVFFQISGKKAYVHAKKLKIEKKCSWNFSVAYGSDWLVAIQQTKLFFLHCGIFFSFDYKWPYILLKSTRKGLLLQGHDILDMGAII